MSDFGQVETGYTAAEARADAARCMRYGCKARFVCDLRRVATTQPVTFAESPHARPRVPIVRDHPLIIRDHNKISAVRRPPVAEAAEHHRAQLSLERSALLRLPVL
jgi:hypothetical protein